jgi:hypothetical protein
MRKGLLKLAMKFAIRSHNDRTYIVLAMQAASYLPAKIANTRFEKARQEVA